MYSTNVEVEYRDGTVKQATLTQWSIGQFAMFAQTKGWKVDPQAPGLLAVPMVRFQAFAELHRDTNGARPTFEKWDATVSEVRQEADEVDSTVDPTEAGQSDG